MADITFKTNKGYFIYRAGAIIVDNGRVLMMRNENHSYYYSIGGRVNFGETAEEAVVREAFEETNIRFEVERLVFIHENFAVMDWLEDDDVPVHEIGFYFLMKPCENIADIKCLSLGADGGVESLHWLLIDELPKYHLYPEFFKSELRELKDGVRRFVTRDGETLLLGGVM